MFAVLLLVLEVISSKDDKSQIRIEFAICHGSESRRIFELYKIIFATWDFKVGLFDNF